MLRVEVQGSAGVDEFLAKLNEALDTEKILDEGAAVLFNRIRTRFLAETAPDGTKWVPSLAAQRRKARGYGGGTLFNTGRLFHSLQIASEGPNARSIGTNVTAPGGYDYPKTHQYGLSGFPKRPFLGFNDDDVAAMSKVVINRVITGLFNE